MVIRMSALIQLALVQKKLAFWTQLAYSLILGTVRYRTQHVAERAELRRLSRLCHADRGARSAKSALKFAAAVTLVKQSCLFVQPAWSLEGLILRCN